MELASDLITCGADAGFRALVGFLFAMQFHGRKVSSRNNPFKPKHSVTTFFLFVNKFILTWLQKEIVPEIGK